MPAQLSGGDSCIGLSQHHDAPRESGHQYDQQRIRLASPKRVDLKERDEDDQRRAYKGPQSVPGQAEIQGIEHKGQGDVCQQQRDVRGRERVTKQSKAHQH